ncbi:peptide ABC transporter permease [Capnocytophaga catalasegens]|uniref:Peptide ABC transporter permease n=2 Tax=Capnocytophaga catalasegens TaxID=1004260 RepID=A0AAV5AYF9_9FLAO|nr:peptide ABC transporter permease [Capnocytophaga catalasegens]GJM50567.1 peptide ABC transporter permease [Capnocytophaga catalasegens]GJM53602.1 peptide ABC transporter permease [Capnocytophaga catalasegens]
MMLDQNENSEQLRVVKQKYGFDKPLLTQYAYYLNDLSLISFHSKQKADYTFFNSKKYNGVSIFSIKNTNIVIKMPYLRESFQKNGKKVTQIIAETLPNTLVLASTAIFIALLIGILFGIVSALQKDTWIDRTIQVISTLGMSIPSFFSAILFAWIFGFLLRDYTGLSMSGSLYEIDDYTGDKYLKISNLLLPAIALGIRPLAVVTQLMRNSLLEVLSQDYIRTAYAKGLSTWQVIYKHALKNSLNPVITALSGWFAGMLAGAVFIEYIFGWNGLGKEIVTALNTLDLPVIMGAVLVISTIFIFINILVDFLYRLLDPRI